MRPLHRALHALLSRLKGPALALLLACSLEAGADDLKEQLAQLRADAEAVGAPGAELDIPCLSDESSLVTSCPRNALRPFFAALERLEASPASSMEPVRVAFFGNSLIAADGGVGFIRRRLVARFGDGGRGLVLADRLGPWGPRVRTGYAKGSWELTTVGMLEWPKLPHGVTGAQHRAMRAGASTHYELQGETHVEVSWTSPAVTKGLSLFLDERPFAEFFPLRPNAPLRAQLVLPATARTLELRLPSWGPVVQGVVLERRTGGIVVDTLGVPSVDASLFLRTDEGLFAEQLRARSPALVVVMLGGNEVKRLAWNRTELPIVETDLRAFIRRTRLGAPAASCLVVSPIDSVQGPSHRQPFQQRPQLAPYLALQRRIALEERCAYFDLFGAMGGAGSLQRFHRRGFMHDDLVHPRGRGLNLLGELVASALLRAYDVRLGADAPAIIVEVREGP